MAQHSLIKSKSKTSNAVILIIVGVLFCGLSYYFIFDSLKHEYPQLVGLVFGVLFGLLGLLFIFSIWLLNNYECDGEKLIVKSIFNSPKKIIYIKEINSFNEIEKRNRYTTYKDLTIFTDKHKQKISSSSISNYIELKTALIKGKVRDQYSEKIWAHKFYRRFGIVLIAIGVLFILGMVLVNSKRDERITSNHLTTIQGTIAEPLKISRNKSSRWLNIKLKEYPKFVFELRGDRFHASRSDAIITEIFPGNQVEIDIFTDTYEKKITKTKEMTFSDKTMYYNQITVNGLKKSDEIYLASNSINIVQEKKSTGGNWMILFVGLAFAGSGIYYITKKKPSAAKTNE